MHILHVNELDSIFYEHKKLNVMDDDTEVSELNDVEKMHVL
jgi:hypothetical protein